MRASITLLPGDGVGPEVTAQARRVLERVAARGGHDFEFQEHLIGGCALDQVGTSLPTETLDACNDCDAILLGAVGGPKWSDPNASDRPELGLLRLREQLGLFANLRPVPVFPALRDLAPLKPELLDGVDLLFVRELTGGIYFGRRREQGDSDSAFDTLEYSVAEVERAAHVAFQAAMKRRKKVASVDKANVLASMRLWRKAVDVVAQHYADVELEHVLVDAMAMHLMRTPARFDVVLAGNMFGDILSDEAAILAGSLGMLPSASLGGGSSTAGLYEPVHGSAPDIAGEGIANPIGAILSAAMLLRHSLALQDEAEAVEAAVKATLEQGLRTPDLGASEEESATTAAVADSILDQLG